MTERAPCPICNFTQLCNCDPQPGVWRDVGPKVALSFEPDYGRLPDGVACDACECVHKAPACVPDVRDGMPDLTWRSGYELTTAPEERTALADIIRGPGTYRELQRMYGCTNGVPIAMPAEKQLSVDMRYPEPSAETLAAYAKFVIPTERVSKDELRRQYPDKLFMNPHDHRELTQSFARARAFEEECKALKRKLHEAAYQRELLAKTPEKIQQDAMAAAAEQLRGHAFVLSDEFRKVGSRDLYPGTEEGAPAPAEGFFTEIKPRISDFSRFEFTVPYHTFHITGIAGEMPKAKAPAFVRHLGESPEQVAMLLAQMSAPPGACSCQRINGFLFACLACSKAGKS